MSETPPHAGTASARQDSPAANSNAPAPLAAEILAYLRDTVRLTRGAAMFPEDSAALIAHAKRGEVLLVRLGDTIP